MTAPAAGITEPVVAAVATYRGGVVWRPSERQVWAVEQLEIKPSDRVLEIGCGRGVAAALVAQRLRTGKMTAIDRSARAIAAAEALNRAAIEAGKVELLAAKLEEVYFGRRRFSVVFAVNVGVFWLGDGRLAVARLNRLVRPNGRLHLIWERPDADRAGAIAGVVRANLERGGIPAQVRTARTRAGTALVDVYAIGA